ncbi:MAG TPA: glycosyltransferase family 4 protein [Xanthomonadaceae bacterium]|jgi:UDP-N-acetylmuramyl pentapeptide phosphotransferase/UDP-N-acetylglucosamine-1-phosphate transferase
MTATIVLSIGGMLVSALLTVLAIRYAEHRRMLDHPGPRRSHDRPTPRGGGVAPVLVVLGGGAWLASQDAGATTSVAMCLCGFAAVAAIGWVDDHRPLSPVVRLVVHIAAAVAITLGLCAMQQPALSPVAIALAAFVVVGLVNAWNFMDGIDALATSQAAVVMAALLAGGWMTAAWQGLCALALAAIVGFLPFNLPRARIFLGDIGSGAFGCLVAMFLLRAVCSGGMPWPLAMLPVSAFLIDAGMTLLLRVVRGKAWWRPHREHLYQWLVRSGNSHGQVAGWYAAWTLSSSILAIAVARFAPAVVLPLTLAVLVSGGSLWLGLRSRLWKDARKRR